MSLLFFFVFVFHTDAAKCCHACSGNPHISCCISTVFTRLEAGGGGLLFIKINLQTRLLIVTRLVNEADIVNKTRPLFTLSLEMTRLVTKTRLLLVPGVNSDIYGIYS